MSKAEMVERLVGPSRQHNEEDIEYWRNAPDEMRGQALHMLLRRGRMIRASMRRIFEGPDVKYGRYVKGL